MIRTILSPGVELNEVDKSQYTTDLGNTPPRALVMGFASKGPAKLTTEITSMADFRTIYGTPTNEVERYFYNATDKLVDIGATVVAAKIPYDGDDNYVGIQYTVEDTTADIPTTKAYLYFTDGTKGTLTLNSNSELRSQEITSCLSENGKEITDIKEVIVGSSCTVVSANVFDGCTNIEKITFNNDKAEVTIGSEAFVGCENLRSIKLPAKAKFYNVIAGQRVFKNCKSLKNVTLPSGMTTVPQELFLGCDSLEQVELVGATSIKTKAFNDCPNLKTVIIRSEITAPAEGDPSPFADDIFNIEGEDHPGCGSLEKVYFENIGAQIAHAIGADAGWGGNNFFVICDDKTNNGADAGKIAIGNPPLSIRNAKASLNKLLEELDNVDSDIRSVDYNTLPATVNNEDVAQVLNIIKNADTTITGLTLVSSTQSLNIDNDTFLALRGGDRTDTTNKTEIVHVLPRNSFAIVDKTRGKYKTFTGNGSNVDCLGILPVVTTAINAMAIAGSLEGVSMNSTKSSDIPTINMFEPLNNIKYIQDSYTTSEAEISGYWSVGPNTIENGNTLNSISKAASQFFPSVVYSSQVGAQTNENGSMPFDHNLFSYIGIVVFQVGIDRGSGCLVAEPIEAFAGSLLANAKDIRTNASTFIENVVNSTSKYISIFVSDDLAFNENKLMAMDKILYANPSTGLILGLPPSAIERKVSYDTIVDNIDDIFKSQSNILNSTLDIVVDAGLSTIAACVKGISAPLVDNLPLIHNCPQSLLDGPWPGWRSVVNLYKKFCEQTRKDCAFVIDAPRFLSLKNQRKRVSAYDSASSVTETILPNIKKISGINTSYGWGYVSWFNISDAADGTSFWCPPSIFGAAAYIVTRTRWNTWDAPAGMTRGVINVNDTSFEPDLNARNVIYSNNWNYALTDIQNGVTTLEGQKTFQAYQSAFDRINVRSLFLDLERRVFRIARNYIYEPNTADTRQQFVDNVTPIFSSTKAQGGCYDYKIIADETLNTPEVIDNNEFRIRIGVQPTKTIEFILIEFVATRTGSDWSELVME